MTVGWCYTRGKSTLNNISVLADVLSYEFWSFLCFLLLTALYVSLFLSMYLRCQVSECALGLLIICRYKF